MLKANSGVDSTHFIVIVLFLIVVVIITILMINNHDNRRIRFFSFVYVWLHDWYDVPNFSDDRYVLNDIKKPHENKLLYATVVEKVLWATE